MNAFPGLTWEFSEPSTTIDFMDMTITINKSNKIETTLFEKRLNLHLYTPPPPPPPTLPTHQGYSQGLYTAHCLKFYPLLVRNRQITTNKGFFQFDCLWL